MIRVSGPAMEKGIASRRYAWRLVCVVGVFLPLLAALFFFAPSPHAFAASHILARRLTSSPSQGPVGAVIVVTGSGMSSPDGTQIDLGYSTDFSNCNAATDSQPGIVQNHAFSGWFRWPAGTGTGNFEVCASVHDSNNPFFAGTYQVLSATPAQVCGWAGPPPTVCPARSWLPSLRTTMARSARRLPFRPTQLPARIASRRLPGPGSRRR